MVHPRLTSALIAAAAWAGLAPGAAAQVAGALPQDRPQYVSRAGTAYYAQRDTGAVARAESLLALDPSNVGRLIQLGLAQASMWQYREAIETYTRGLVLAPNDALLYRYRGHRYISVRELDRAAADLERGAGLDSASYDIWYHLGIARYLRGEFDRAADAFARAQRLAPNDNEIAGSTDWLWMSLRRAGRRREAEEALARLRDSLAVTSAQAYWRRLQLYRGRIGPEQVITPADTGDLVVATLGYGIGNWYLVNGDPARAREWFQRVVRTTYWPAFGFIAAEEELRRVR